MEGTVCTTPPVSIGSIGGLEEITFKTNGGLHPELGIEAESLTPYVYVVVPAGETARAFDVLPAIGLLQALPVYH